MDDVNISLDELFDLFGGDGGTAYTEKKAKEIEKKIEAIYKQAAKEVNQKVSDFTRRHKIKADIKLKELKEGKITQAEYDRWMKGQIFQRRQWLALENHATDIYVNANKAALDVIRKGAFDVLMENANYERYALEKGAGINFGFGLYDYNAVSNLILNDPQVLPKKKLDARRDKPWNMRIIRSEIAQTIIQGEPLENLAKRLAVATGSKNMNLMRTHARTSLTGAQNSGRMQTLKDALGMSINVLKEWMATLDERTRTSHQELDGEKKKVNQKFSNGLKYPGDPEGHPREVYNCRCTLVGDLTDYPEDYERYDNINGRPIKNMTYKEWKAAKEGMTSIGKFQSQLGAAKTVNEVNDLMNGQGWFRTDSKGRVSKADLTGCDLDSAKSIAASYEQVFTKYPQLKGRLDAPDAHPIGMGSDTYAWCFIRRNGKVQVNPNMYNNWKNVERSYESDVTSGYHPFGTTAESIVTHEIGHAIDGLLAREGVKGGITASGEYRYASSSMRNTIMKRVLKLDSDIKEAYDKYERWDDSKWAMSRIVKENVSRYGSKNPQEWFAECFAEYITSANPRLVADEFGKELEKLLEGLK